MCIRDRIEAVSRPIESNSDTPGSKSCSEDSNPHEDSSKEINETSVCETVGDIWRAAPCSTPIGRSGRPSNPLFSPILGLHGVHRRARLRMRRGKKRPIRLNSTEEMRVPVPAEKNHWMEAMWRATLASLLCYMDDGFSKSKINFENSYGFQVNWVKHQVKHAIQSQNVFRHLVRNAEDIGMKVNAGKTTLVCFSDTASFEADAYIEDSDGRIIRGQKTMKALGLRMSIKPDMSEHVK